MAIAIRSARMLLRPLEAADGAAYIAFMEANEEHLRPWQPAPAPGSTAQSRFEQTLKRSDDAVATGRELRLFAFALGGGVEGAASGEMVGWFNLNNVARGALQSATIGYWIDREQAGNAYVAEAVVVLMRFAFEQLQLHRLEICIVPRNMNSRRVVEKLEIRCEGVAERFLEINGVWEDHLRFAITAEEWLERADELTARWITG